MSTVKRCLGTFVVVDRTQVILLQWFTLIHLAGQAAEFKLARIDAWAKNPIRLDQPNTFDRLQDRGAAKPS